MAKNNKEALLRKPFVRTGLILALLIAIVVLVVFAFDYVSSLLYYNNPHFRLKNVVVKSSGYWDNRVDDIMSILSLKKGVTNLFSLDLHELRSKLERMGGEGIFYVEVTRELPDTLKFSIVERIPRALLYSKKSNMLADKDGVVINSKYFSSIIDALPVITGFRLPTSVKNKKSPYGETINSIKPALIFISIVGNNYMDMDIRVINLYLQNRLVVFMAGNKDKVIKIILPFEFNIDAPPTQTQIAAETKKIKVKLKELKELLQYLKWKNTDFSEINLLYKDQAIVK